MEQQFIPFNRASLSPSDLILLEDAVKSGRYSGNGYFSRVAESILSELHDGSRVLATSSCTHALELSARLINLEPADEVIVSSFTFVTGASAFLSNGAYPVFADICSDTLNINLESAESRITRRTKAICITHYGGVGADPVKFRELADAYGLILIEDNAHGLGGTFDGKRLGTFGHLSTLSFHETKNITCGEGGALVVNDKEMRDRAEILRDKGTNRKEFQTGRSDKYTWVDNGSSWVLSEFQAALLTGQLKRFEEIQILRLEKWHRYHDALHDWCVDQGIQSPQVPISCRHTGHIYHLRLPTPQLRDRFLEHLHEHGVNAVFHYSALHSSPVGRGLDPSAVCPVADRMSDLLVRLPIYVDLDVPSQDRVIEVVTSFRL